MHVCIMYMFVYIYTYMNAYIHEQMHILINTYASLMRFLEKVPSRGVSSVPVSLHLPSPRQPLASVPMEAEQRCFTTGSTQSAPQWPSGAVQHTSTRRCVGVASSGCSEGVLATPNPWCGHSTTAARGTAAPCLKVR